MKTKNVILVATCLSTLLLAGMAVDIVAGRSTVFSGTAVKNGLLQARHEKILHHVSSTGALAELQWKFVQGHVPNR